MFVASEGQFAGLIAVSDPIKSTTLDAIQQLKDEGIKVLMVTGDNQITAAAVATKLGIDFEADVLPEKKSGGRQEAPVRGCNCRYGWRRLQRCACSGSGECLDRYGDRDRRCHEDWRHHVDQGRPSRDRQSKAAESAHHVEHSLKLVLCILLQRSWCAARCGCPVPVLRTLVEPDDCSGRYELQLRLNDCQRA
jgi:magnesium-transporting ATPase (P-type)